MSLLLIRLDDITPTMNWENFNYIRQIFERLDVKPIIGVVPDNQDPKLDYGVAQPSFWEIVKELQEKGWTIAQHGYRHVYEETGCQGILHVKHDSEFAGIPFEEQRIRLQSGKEILQSHGITATMFMAPAHSYDKNTLKALKELGFESMTDGYAESPYRYKGLKFIPCRTDKPVKPKVVDTICLHINGMKKEEFDKLEKYIAKNRKMFVSADDILNHYPDRCRNGLSEWKNIKVRNIKKWAAEDEVVQGYLSETQGNRFARLMKLPVLLARLMVRKNSK
ncbi:MAG: DUF2334 domain-containing protein [Lachnospiraceae bacterium]|nr:DUF2334 domain-containing protein [Candidatus Merdinaster equi]